MVAEWTKYLEHAWKPWAEKHQRWKNVQGIYARLFTAYQQQKRLGEAYELVLGLGLLTWITPSGQRVRRHLLVGQANLVFDANRGALSVQPASDGVKLALETDMLEPGERPAIEQQLAIEDTIQRVSEAPWEREFIDPVIRSWVNALDSQARYEDCLEPNAALSAHPIATFAPAVILRKRTSRNLIRLLTGIIKNLSSGGEIPFGVQRLCEITDDSTSERDRELLPEFADSDFKQDSDIYFPLPANDEQRQIVSRLAFSQGIVVQGPPGTGKSHTIANLICHLLACGKRVLVASQTPRALKVLKDKIPEQLSALTVSLLGNDALALQDLEDSVLGITERYYGWQPRHNKRQISDSEASIAQYRKAIAKVDQLLRELREKETYKHQVADGIYSGTSLQISQIISQQSKLHGWFPDAIAESAKIPFDRSAFERLLAEYRYLTKEHCAELSQKVLGSDEIPDSDTLLNLIKKERTAAFAYKKYEQRGQDPGLEALLAASPDNRTALSCDIKKLRDAISNCQKRNLSWVNDAIDAVLTGKSGPWDELRRATPHYLKALTEKARAAQARKIECPRDHRENRERLRQDAYDLWLHLDGGHRLGWGPFRKAVVKRAGFLTREVRVSGRLCNTKDAIAELIEHLDFETQLDLAWEEWKGIAKRTESAVVRQVMDLQVQFEVLELVLAIKIPLANAKNTLAHIATTEPNWADHEAVEGLLSDLEAVEATATLQSARSKVDEVVDKFQRLALRPNAHPLCRRAIKALQQRDVDSWAAVLNEIQTLETDRDSLADRQKLAETLSKAAPNLLLAISTNPHDPSWDERLANIEQTWAWARADGWLRVWDADHSVDQLEPRRIQLSQLLQQEIASLAAEKAWGHCFARLSEEQRQHLMAWTKAVKRIGKGTGKRAEKHRRDAQMHMAACRDAIPAWIMPFYRVAESLSATPDAFDVVIVDEASQSGPETLLLTYLAKKCLIVGDDQQISPDAVGIVREDVDLLIARHLEGHIRHTDSFGVESSLFDHAVIRYGGRIVLREHFRCMPEIIRFSNDLCYSATPLLPLRQYPAQRLEPIIVRHIRDGFREGGSQSAKNVPEAEALVEAICQCCRDPRYAGKTLGVISLQGEHQARVIERLLLDQLEPEEIEARELVCGDAYAFQGDERNIIFLSMVAAPNERIGALTKDADKRRFNVAASRAKDQLWLFYTATLNDLNPNDMRYKLLSYCLNPERSIVGEPDWSRCESEFEREVGKLMHAKKYRILVQHEPFGRGGKRIDFVVEGMKSRLAVECDGDRWHGLEKYEEDMLRQRQLERCGWNFWRVRGSTFYRDRNRALEPLWQRLTEMGIDPIQETADAQFALAAAAPVSSVTEAPAEVEQVATEAEPAFLQFEERNRNARNIDAIRDVELRLVLFSSIPEDRPASREWLMVEAAKHFGYNTIPGKLRERFTKALDGLEHAGRIATDMTTVRVNQENPSD